MIVCTNFHGNLSSSGWVFFRLDRSGWPTLQMFSGSCHDFMVLSVSCSVFFFTRAFNILHTVVSYYVAIRNRQTQRLSFTPSRIQFAVSPFKNVFSCEMDKRLNHKRESEPLDHSGRQKWTQPAPWKIILLSHSSLVFLLLLVIKR